MKVFPSYWTESQETKFTNLLKEHAHRLQAVKRGDCPETALATLTYETVAKEMDKRISPFQGEGEYKFTPTQAPLGWGSDVGCRKTWAIKDCAGYGHCEQACVVNGFFFKGARSVHKDAIFRDWDEIVNEIALHLRSCGTPHSKI